MPTYPLACTSDEYTCLDGTCVQMDKVCDGKMDCTDKSDELECHSINFDATYLKNLPPPPLKTKAEGNKTPLNISITVESILDLDEVRSLMKLQLQLEVVWIDPRLEFTYLKRGKDTNSLSLDQKRKLWLPTLIFANNKQKMKATFDDNDSIGNIILVKNAPFELSPLHEVKRTRIFDGKHG